MCLNMERLEILLHLNFQLVSTLWKSWKERTRDKVVYYLAHRKCCNLTTYRTVTLSEKNKYAQNCFKYMPKKYFFFVHENIFDSVESTQNKLFHDIYLNIFFVRTKINNFVVHKHKFHSIKSTQNQLFHDIYLYLFNFYYHCPCLIARVLELETGDVITDPPGHRCVHF